MTKCLAGVSDGIAGGPGAGREAAGRGVAETKWKSTKNNTCKTTAPVEIRQRC